MAEDRRASARSALRRYAPMIYGPTALFSIGEGAVLPFIPVIAVQLGASLALSGLIASALVIGQLCGNLPAGWFVARFGERLTMLFSAALALLGVLGLALAPNLTMLAVSVFVIGLCAAAFSLARLAFMTVHVPFAYRARALSLIGGTARFGIFVGPFVAALLLSATGIAASAAWCFAVCLVACMLLVGLGPQPERHLSEETLVGHSHGSVARSRSGADAGDADGLLHEDRDARVGSHGVLRTAAIHRRVLSTLGLAAASLAAVRSARDVVLPIWGLSIGLDAQSIALVVGLSGALDFALFYASGWLMDRFGRLWATLPSMTLMGIGFLLLSLTHDWGGAALWFAVCASIIGVGNGLSSGILMTLGADLAPQGDPAPFLGVWRTLNDGGRTAAPVLFSALAAGFTMSVATGAMGAIALLGVLGFVRWVPRFLPRQPKP